MAFIVFREAQPASTWWNITKTLVLMVLLWGVFFVALPLLCWQAEAWAGVSDYRFAGPVPQVAGWVLIFLGSTLHVVSNLVLAVRGEGTPLPCDGPRRLVIAGPYRYLRNPIAVSGFAQAMGVALVLGSPLALAYAMLLAVAEDFVLRPAQEADLFRRFGEEYRRYRQRVRCWRPRLRSYHPAREAQEPPVASEQTTPPGRHVVLYDGHCKFCTASARHLVALGRNGVLDLVSFQDPGALDRFPGITHEACMRMIYLVTPEGRVYGGVEAVVQALGTRPLLRWIAYAYYLPGIRLLCDIVYATIAAHRYRILGRTVAAGDCEDGTCSLHFPPRK